MRLAEVLNFLEQFAPLETAEDWDNVGLLLGARDREVERVLTCLTLTPDVAQEAVQQGVGLIVTHHPILFRPIQRITAETVEGAMLLDLIRAGVAVYSPHTAFDSAREGINAQWCERLELRSPQPLRWFPEHIPAENPRAATGSGRAGELAQPISLATFLECVKQAVGLAHLQYVGDSNQEIQKVAVACGAAAMYLDDAARLECDLLLTGEARFHDCLKARGEKIALVLVGHYASERFACEWLAEHLQKEFPQLQIHASQAESDPLHWG